MLPLLLALHLCVAFGACVGARRNRRQCIRGCGGPIELAVFIGSPHCDFSHFLEEHEQHVSIVLLKLLEVLLFAKQKEEVIVCPAKD